MNKAFVTGFPIKHSKSPLLHGFWLEELGIEGSYEAVEVDPKSFDSFLNGLKDQGFSGGNITLPHKETAHSFIANLDDAAQIIGAVNTVWFENGELCGGNTDAYGFSANLDDYTKNWRAGKTAIILGAGGASRAVIYAVLDAGYDKVHIINRTLSRAEALAGQFGEKCQAHSWNAISKLLPDCDLLVNTTSIGMAGHDAGSETPMPDLSVMQQSAIVTDIVYTPLETPILASAKQQGLKTVDGLGMLLHQAVPGFEKWFGIRPKVTPKLRAHILEALG